MTVASFHEFPLVQPPAEDVIVAGCGQIYPDDHFPAVETAFSPYFPPCETWELHETTTRPKASTAFDAFRPSFRSTDAAFFTYTNTRP
jgi:hypothetical protein